MNSINIIVLLMSIFAITQALEKDAEIVPSNKTGSSNPRGEDPVIIVNLSPSPFRPVFGDLDPISRLFNRIFRGSSFPFPPADTDVLNVPSFSPGSSRPHDFGVPNLRDLVFNFPASRFPDLSAYPDNYDNSTHEVQIVNGTKIEVNRTISKSKDRNGVFVQEVQIVRYAPERDDGAPSDDPEDAIPEVDTKSSPSDPAADTPEIKNRTITKTKTENEFEDFGITPVIPKRKRRWVVPDFIQKIYNVFRRKSQLGSDPTITSSDKYGSLLGDTKVNYVRENTNKLETDALIFDPKLLQKDRQNSLNEKTKNHVSEFQNSLNEKTKNHVSEFQNSHNLHTSKNRQPLFLKEKENNENSLLGKIEHYNNYNNRYYNEIYLRKPKYNPSNNFRTINEFYRRQNL